MRPVRFVHAADLHLEAPFAGIDASDPVVRSSLVASTYQAFERVVSLCLDEAVDFLVLAGDVYDNARNFNAQIQFRKQAERLAAAGIPCFVTEGNHDPESARPRDLTLPDNVHYFSTGKVERVLVERDGEVVCSLYGRGYARAAETRDLAKDFRRAEDDVIAIGVLHTNVGGQEGHEDYAPCSMDELRAARMDYWALGHIHKPGVLSASPAVAYAGCPQGRNPKEDGPRGCYLVEVAPGHADVAFRPMASIEWYRRTIDISGCDSLDDVASALSVACSAVRAESASVPTIVRLDLVGRAAAHAGLVRGTNLSDLVRELRQTQLAEEPWMWIDRVVDRSAAPLDIENMRRAQDFAGDLVRLVVEMQQDPESVERLVDEIVSPLESSLGTLELQLTPLELLERARDVCLDRLEAGA